MWRNLKLQIIWRRGNDNPSFTKPKTFFSLGQIDSGKSCLLEHLAIKHYEKGATILDLFGSADGENLGWLRSPIAKGANVCLLRGENVDVETEHDVRTVENLGLHDLEI